jgi:hypothetical protein
MIGFELGIFRVLTSSMCDVSSQGHPPSRLRLCLVWFLSHTFAGHACIPLPRKVSESLMDSPSCFFRVDMSFHVASCLESRLPEGPVLCGLLRPFANIMDYIVFLLSRACGQKQRSLTEMMIWHLRVVVRVLGQKQFVSEEVGAVMSTSPSELPNAPQKSGKCVLIHDG